MNYGEVISMKEELKQALDHAFDLYGKGYITANEIVFDVLDFIDTGEEYIQVCNAIEKHVGHSIDR